LHNALAIKHFIVQRGVERHSRQSRQINRLDDLRSGHFASPVRADPCASRTTSEALIEPLSRARRIFRGSFFAGRQSIGREPELGRRRKHKALPERRRWRNIPAQEDTRKGSGSPGLARSESAPLWPSGRDRRREDDL